jgi:hypothetical protein
MVGYFLYDFNIQAIFVNSLVLRKILGTWYVTNHIVSGEAERVSHAARQCVYRRCIVMSIYYTVSINSPDSCRKCYKLG